MGKRGCLVVACGLAAFSYLLILSWINKDAALKTSNDSGGDMVAPIRQLHVMQVGLHDGVLFPGHKVFAFNDVCITDSPLYKINVDKKHINFTKKITVFNSSFHADRDKLRVDSHFNAKSREWDVIFTNDTMNGSFKVLERTAIFVIPTCPGNLHHFWTDEFLALQSLVRQLNLTTPLLPNHFLYRFPADPWKPSCSSVDRYSLILSALNMESHKWFADVEHGTCYKQAIFGQSPLFFPAPSAAEFVLDQLHSGWSNCTKKTVTILKRAYRKILNVEEVERVLVQHNHSVNVVEMERLSDIDQLQTAMCSSALIGVQGAGLQWLVFMQKGSVLVEIAWPKHRWGFYYGHIAKQYQQIHRSVEAEDVHLNWGEYEKVLRHGVKVSEAERKKLIKSKPASAGDNIWKYADVTVDPQKILAAVNKNTLAKSLG